MGCASGYDCARAAVPIAGKAAKAAKKLRRLTSAAIAHTFHSIEIRKESCLGYIYRNKILERHSELYADDFGASDETASRIPEPIRPAPKMSDGSIVSLKARDESRMPRGGVARSAIDKVPALKWP